MACVYHHSAPGNPQGAPDEISLMRLLGLAQALVSRAEALEPGQKSANETLQVLQARGRGRKSPPSQTELPLELSKLVLRACVCVWPAVAIMSYVIAGHKSAPSRPHLPLGGGLLSSLRCEQSSGSNFPLQSSASTGPIPNRADWRR